MRTITLFTWIAIISACFVILAPRNSEAVSKKKKLLIAKKIAAAAILLLRNKKLLFTFPLPIPIPYPILKKTQPIIYKERVHVPIPIEEPYPEPTIIQEHYAVPEPKYHVEQVNVRHHYQAESEPEPSSYGY